MTEPIEKVRRLIALALGTSAPEEARTSALIAVRLINEHKLLDAPPVAAAPRARPSASGRWEDVWNDLERMARERTRNHAPPRPRAARPEPPKPRPAPEPWNPKEWKRPEAPPGCMWTKACMRKACLRCNTETILGEDVLREKGCGYFHAKCWAEVVSQ